MQLLEPGDRVIVEQPSYDRTLLLLGRAGVELVPVPLEADGIDVAAVEAALAEGPVKLAHVIPNFHNPAGCTLSEAKRERLVELAAEHGFRLFEDDPYRLISFGGGELPTMLSLDGAERVIHASSFSKTVSPGVRVGYLAGPAEEIATLAKRANENYISPNMLAESIVLELCRSGALETQRRVGQRCAARPPRRARRGALRAPARGGVRRPRRAATSSGSTSPRAPTPATLLEPAKEEGVAFVAGPDFMLEGGESQPAPLVRGRPARADRRGRGAHRPALERVRAAPPA